MQQQQQPQQGYSNQAQYGQVPQQYQQQPRQFNPQLAGGQRMGVPGQPQQPQQQQLGQRPNYQGQTGPGGRPVPPAGFRPYVPEPPVEHMCDIGGIMSLLFGAPKAPPPPPPAAFLAQHQNNFGAYSNSSAATPAPYYGAQQQQQQIPPQQQVPLVQRQQPQPQSQQQYRQQLEQERYQQQQTAQAASGSNFQKLMEDAKKRNSMLRAPQAAPAPAQTSGLQIDTNIHRDGDGTSSAPPSPVVEAAASMAGGLFGTITNFVGFQSSEAAPQQTGPIPPIAYAPPQAQEQLYVPPLDLSGTHSEPPSVGQQNSPRLLTLNSKSSSYFSVHEALSAENTVATQPSVDSVKRRPEVSSNSADHSGSSSPRNPPAANTATDDKTEKLERLLSVHGVQCRLLMPPAGKDAAKDIAKGKKSSLRLTSDGREFVLEILSSKPGVQGKRLNFKVGDVTAVNKGRSAMLSGLPGFDDSKILHFSLTGKPELNLEVEDSNIRDALAVGLWGVAARRRTTASRNSIARP